MAMVFRDLGWPETPESDAKHRTFQCTNGVVIGLYAAKHYEPEFGPPASGFRAFTLCVNLESFEECCRHETLPHVDGVELLEARREAFWGGGFSCRPKRNDSSGRHRKP